MSINSARKYIKDHISKFDNELDNILSTKYRDSLNSRTTILDVSKKNLAVTITTEVDNATFNELYEVFFNTLLEYMSDRTYHNLEEALLDRGPDRLLFNPFLVNGPVGRFIVAHRYGTAQEIIRHIASDDKLISTAFGKFQRYNEKTGKYNKEQVNLELGHIASPNNPNLTSPLEEKLQALSIHYKENPIMNRIVQDSLKELYTIQSKFKFTFENTAPEAIETARGILGLGYVVVTLQTSTKNGEFSLKEANLEQKLLMKIVSAIDPLQIPGSNTLIEDIVESITAIISGKKGPTKHNKVIGSLKNKPAKPSVKTASVSGSTTPKLRNVSGKFYSLASLQLLLNTHLQNVVSANMGDQGYPGGQRRILNYRTGRFAASVNVERLSMSKEGAISAFYSYMKNPYQTFEPGYVQGSPKTRDPKLLIAKSIKEIAATTVTNRMRAVLV